MSGSGVIALGADIDSSVAKFQPLAAAPKPPTGVESGESSRQGVRTCGYRHDGDKVPFRKEKEEGDNGENDLLWVGCMVQETYNGQTMNRE